MEPSKNDTDDENADVCLQCNSRRERENQEFRSATRKVALLTAICSILCVLTITACCCSLYFYTRFQGFRQELVELARMNLDGTDDLLADHFATDYNAMPMYGEPMDDEEYQDFVDEQTRGIRHRRKKEKSGKTPGKARKGGGSRKPKCRKKQKKICDCCKEPLKQYIDKTIEEETTNIKKDVSSLKSQISSTQADQATDEDKTSYVSAAHYTTYVDESYINDKFGGMEHDFDKHRPKNENQDMDKGSDSDEEMHLDVPEWHGTLYRNRTFVTTAAPLTLRFFREADWMKNSTTVKIFDFDESTGKFTAKHTGLYHLYAHAQFRISREDGIAMVHRTPSGFEILNMFQCGTNETIAGMKGIGKPCTLGGVVLMNENEYIEIQLLDNRSLLSVKMDHMYFGAFFLQYV